MPATINTFVEHAQLALFGVAAVNTTTTYFDSANLRCSFANYANSALNGDTSSAITVASGVVCALPSAQSTLWLSFDIYPRAIASTASTSMVIISLRKSGTPYLRLVKLTTSTNVQWQRLVSGTWTAIGSPFAAPDITALTRVDIQIVVHASAGIINTYYNGSSVNSNTSIDTQSDNPGVTLDGFAFGSLTNSTNTTTGTHWSAIWTSDESTIGYYPVSLPLSGAGDNSSWADSAYANLNTVTRGDTSAMHTTSAAQRSDFAKAGLGAGTDTVINVQAYARAGRNGASPTQAAAYLRIGGTNYDGASKAVALGIDGLQWSWTTNPAGGAWTRSAVDSAKVGVLSVA